MDFRRQPLHELLVFSKVRIAFKKKCMEGLFEHSSGMRADALDAFQNIALAIRCENEHVHSSRDEKPDRRSPEANEKCDDDMVMNDFNHRDGCQCGDEQAIMQFEFVAR